MSENEMDVDPMIDDMLPVTGDEPASARARAGIDDTVGSDADSTTPVVAPEDSGEDEESGEGENWSEDVASSEEEDSSEDVEPDEDVESDEEGDEGSSSTARPKGARSKARVVVLEREGEVAADFLERLLDIADLDGDIDVDIDGDRAAVSIVDSEEGRVPRRLVGPEGRVLDALQELTRLAVQTATGERSRLMLDVAGFRSDRRAALVTLARESIAQVRASGVALPLANMTAFERKVVHDEVTAAGLVSESEGVEPHRHIVISLT